MKFIIGDLVLAKSPNFKFFYNAKPSKCSSNIGIIETIIEHNRQYRISWLRDKTPHVVDGLAGWFYGIDTTEIHCTKLNNNKIVKVLYGK